MLSASFKTTALAPKVAQKRLSYTVWKREEEEIVMAYAKKFTDLGQRIKWPAVAEQLGKTSRQCFDMYNKRAKK